MSPRSHPLATAPESEPTAEARDALVLTDDAREALLARLEAWIAEEERLVDAIERRIAALNGKLVPFPARPASG